MCGRRRVTRGYLQEAEILATLVAFLPVCHANEFATPAFMWIYGHGLPEIVLRGKSWYQLVAISADNETQAAINMLIGQ
jgi:hypothetical protein